MIYSFIPYLRGFSQGVLGEGVVFAVALSEELRLFAIRQLSVLWIVFMV